MPDWATWILRMNAGMNAGWMDGWMDGWDPDGDRLPTLD